MNATTLQVIVDTRIKELVEQHGSLRAAAKAIDMDAGYLSNLAKGKRQCPSDGTLHKLGLRRVISYERLVEA